MPRILVVDDEPDILEVMCNWLTLRQYDVLSASNSAEAVRLASVGEPDLILLDASMPGVGGIETCRTLRTTERTYHVPIILVTGPDLISGRIDALMAGAHDFIPKPVALDDLNTRIHSLLSDNGTLASRDISLSADVMQGVLSILSCDLAWLFAVTSHDDILVSVSTATRWNPATAPSLREEIVIPLEPEASRVARAALSRVAEFNLPSLGLSDFPRQVNKACQDLDLVSLSLIPLYHGKSVLGVLLVGGRGDQDIESAEGRQRMAAAVNQVTMALENYRLAHRLADTSAAKKDKQAEQVTSLWQALESIQGAATLDEALQIVLIQAVKMLDAVLATVLLLTGQRSDVLIVHAAAGLEARKLLGAPIPKDGIARVVLDRRVPVLENDARHAPHFMLGFDEQWGVQVKSILAAPLQIGGRAIGVLEVINKHNGGFNQVDQESLQGLAYLVSLVIEKGRLHAALTERASTGRSMHEPWLEPAETVEVASADILPPHPGSFAPDHLLDLPLSDVDTAQPSPGKKRLPGAAELLGLIQGIAHPVEQTVQSRPTVEMDIDAEMSAAEKRAMEQLLGHIKAGSPPKSGGAKAATAPMQLPDRERGKRIVEAEPGLLYRSMASLEHVAQSALDAVRSLAEQSGVELVTFIDGYLPDIYIDKGRILDVIETLLEGAIKASIQGGYVKFSITDISESLQVKISYPEAELPPEDYPSIQRVIEEHEGHFDVKAEPEKGTAFVFTLPKAEVTGMGDFLPAF